MLSLLYHNLFSLWKRHSTNKTCKHFATCTVGTLFMWKCHFHLEKFPPWIFSSLEIFINSKGHFSNGLLYSSQDFYSTNLLGSCNQATLGWQWKRFCCLVMPRNWFCFFLYSDTASLTANPPAVVWVAGIICSHPEHRWAHLGNSGQPQLSLGILKFQEKQRLSGLPWWSSG